MMLMAALTIIGMVAAFAIYNEKTFLDHRIGSERFQAIQNGHDFIADYLPPPLLPYEAFTLVHLTRDTVSGDVNKEVTRWKELHASFNDRLKHWDGVMAENPFLPADKYKHFRDGLAENAKVFFDKLESQVIPALQAKDMTRADVAIGELTSSFVKFEKFVQDTQVSSTSSSRRTKPQAATPPSSPS